MKQIIKTMLVLTLTAGFVFSGPRPIPKSEIQMTKMKRSEPDYRQFQDANRAVCPYVYPNNANSALTLIDSSANGFGMWATVTRPMNVMSDGNMVVVYRQYAGENTTHGQLGAGYGVVSDGEIQWDVQYNVNYNGNPPWGGGGVGYTPLNPTAQARYPSSLASEEYPYAIWNEYTGGPPTATPWPAECSDYGGRPYFSYDEFGWGGESWLYPVDLDPLYDCSKDLWQGSVGYGYDAATDQHHVSAVYDDWTRGGSYLFTSEAVEDGYIVLGTETLIVNPQHQGTEDYSSSAILSMNDDGQGILGVDGIFAGSEPDAGACAQVCGPPASNLTCHKVPMFKLTNDFGQTWAGNHAAFDFYYVPDAVFENDDMDATPNNGTGIFDSWPDEVIIDECLGQAEEVCGYWSWYEFDMRIDSEGNPHIVISLLAETSNDLLTIPGKTGFYHLTIDRNMLGNNHDDNPQWVNTPQGWNWSYIPLPANDSFDWTRPDGSTSYLFGAMCQISLVKDDPNIVYMVANIAETGPMSSIYDANGDGVEDDPCVYQDWPWQLYPEWSEDIWVARSSDNGTTWTALENLTQTPRDVNGPNANLNQHCSPEEQLVHTAHWSDDNRVYYQFHQPNWEFNEIGDQLGADHMNRIFLGYSWVEDTGVGGCTDPTVCNYCEECGFDDGSCANVAGTVACPDGTSGCDCNGDCFTYIDQSLQVIDCNGNCGGGFVQACNDDGGFGDCLDGTEICDQYLADSCDESDGDPVDDSQQEECDEFSCYEEGIGENGDVNSWSGCDDVPCGLYNPLLGCDITIANMNGFPTCDGGRCYTCFGDPTIDNYEDCAANQHLPWDVATVDDCDDGKWGACSVETETTVTGCTGAGGEWTVCLDAVTGCTLDYDTDVGGLNCDDGATCTGTWIPFTYEGQTTDFDDCMEDEANCPEDVAQPKPGSPDECKCTASVAESGTRRCFVRCAADDGNLNASYDPATGLPTFNVLDIVLLANCVLAENCGLNPDGSNAGNDFIENGCAADLNGDTAYNVLDIVLLANCVLANNCGGRVDDASEAALIKNDNKLSFEADGFIGGVQMTLTHGSDFTIEMTDRALVADYLTTGNETRLLVISPETDELFSFTGEFEIVEAIVANSEKEVSVNLPLAASFNLSDAYPNPFNPVTTMTLTMPMAGDMKVEVYNLLGQVVATLASGYMEASTYTLTWDASNASSGVYFVQADAAGFTKTQKLMLVK